MMEERRQFVRLDARLKSAYTALPEEHPRAALTRNLSGGGLCVFAAEPLAPGTRLQMEVIVPDREEPIPFIAEVVWSEASWLLGAPHPERAAEIGVRFVEIAPEDQAMLVREVAMNLMRSASGALRSPESTGRR